VTMCTLLILHLPQHRKKDGLSQLPVERIQRLRTFSNQGRSPRVNVYFVRFKLDYSIRSQPLSICTISINMSWPCLNLEPSNICFVNYRFIHHLCTQYLLSSSNFQSVFSRLSPLFLQYLLAIGRSMPKKYPKFIKYRITTT
jgi:hypothetical protein